MKVLGMSSGLNEFHDFASFNVDAQELSLRERHLRPEAEVANVILSAALRNARGERYGKSRGFAGSSGLAPAEQVDGSDNQSDHQQQMDQSTSHVKTPTQKPEDDQNRNDGPKHRLTVKATT
jgi:hypothetical protein